MNTMKYTRDNLKDVLNAGYATVTFTKADGSNRVMECTLRHDLIPEANRPKGESQIKENLDTIRVFDIEKNAWRSFRVDSVISVESAE